MKTIVKALYNEPVIFLATVQLVLTALAAENVTAGWIPVVSLAVVTGLQRFFVNPKGAA